MNLISLRIHYWTLHRFIITRKQRSFLWEGERCWKWRPNKLSHSTRWESVPVPRAYRMTSKLEFLVCTTKPVILDHPTTFFTRWVPTFTWRPKASSIFPMFSPSTGRGFSKTFHQKGATNSQLGNSDSCLFPYYFFLSSGWMTCAFPPILRHS